MAAGGLILHQFGNVAVSKWLPNVYPFIILSIGQLILDPAGVFHNLDNLGVSWLTPGGTCSGLHQVDNLAVSNWPPVDFLSSCWLGW